MPVGFRVQPCPILHRCPMHRGVGPGRARQRPGGAQVEEDPVILPQNGLVKASSATMTAATTEYTVRVLKDVSPPPLGG